MIFLQLLSIVPSNMCIKVYTQKDIIVKNIINDIFSFRTYFLYPQYSRIKRKGKLKKISHNNEASIF